MKRKLIVGLMVLASATLVACGGGGGDAPGQAADQLVEAPIYPTFEQTALMRDQVGREVDWGSDDTQLGMRIFNNDLDEIARMFREDEGAVMCQGAAYYLHLKYLKAGYSSYLIGFKGEIYSHVMALVEVTRADGTTALIVQDPSFNLSYVGPDGHPLSIFEILTALAERRPQDVIVKQGLPAEVEYLWSPRDPVPAVGGTSYVTLNAPGPSEHPLFSVYPATVSLRTFNDSYADATRDYTAREGLPNNSLYVLFSDLLYVYKRYPMGPQEAAEAQAVFDRIKVHQDSVRGGA